MPSAAVLTSPTQWTCHWGDLTSLNRMGRPTRTRVWICEYPYRTIRTDGPCDCEQCQTPSAALLSTQHLTPST